MNSAPTPRTPGRRTPRLWVIVGATGTGKTDLSLRIVDALATHGVAAEVVNADAMQLYRGMDIGTAKLTVPERRGIPHHLFDVLDVTDEAAVAWYQERARAAIGDIFARGGDAVLVGGSGLYVSSVIYDFRFPPHNDELRAELEGDLARDGVAALFARLRALDPDTAARIDPRNGRRIVRALEVLAQGETTHGAALPEAPQLWQPRTTLIGVHVDRGALVERLDSRVEGMWNAGLLDEVRRLRPLGLEQGATAPRAIGYAQALEELDGKISRPEAIAQTQALTRRYARRQVSWFRRYDRLEWVSPDVDAADLVRAVREADRADAPAYTGAVSTIAFTKGHGTGNDFVIVPDIDGTLHLSDDQVAALCDRRFGIGGDGILRVVRSASLPEGAATADAEWFMDYRNADGSAAEMCGNGIRVYTRYLVDSGLIELPAGATVAVGTRAGTKQVSRSENGFEVDLGVWRAEADEVTVRARGLDVARPGQGIDVGNPHVVVALSSPDELDGLDLTVQPILVPLPAAGANIEFVVPADPLVQDGVGAIRMRVFERGVGETLSCGTGVAAAALAVRHWAGPAAPARWQVDVPGGRLGVRIVGRDDGEHVLLSGPATLVYSGEVALA